MTLLDAEVDSGITPRDRADEFLNKRNEELKK